MHPPPSARWHLLLGALLIGALLSWMAPTAAAAPANARSGSPGQSGAQSGAQGADGAVAYLAPVPLVVVRGFNGPAQPWLPGHRGVDLAAAPGTAVRAAADGVVAFAGVVVDRPVISIDHADGIRTTYEPVAPEVVAGQRVKAGERIGTLRAGHCSVRACLHWGARQGGTYQDPLSLLATRPVRLYPARPFP